MTKEEVDRMPFYLDHRESEFYKMAGLETARKVLSTQLEARFGRLPRTVRDRLEQADAKQFDRWLKQFAVAGKVSDVFQ